MKILFVYKYLTLGGCETVLRARLEALPALGADAHAWFLEDGPGRILFRGAASRVRVGDVGAFAHAIASEAWDIVATLDTPEVIPALRGSGAPRLVVEVHTPYAQNRAYLATLRAPVAAYLVPSRHQADVVRRHARIAAPVHVVPNPLAAPFATVPAPFVPAPPRPVIGWIGRLDPLKNWTGFLELAGRLGLAGRRAEFWLIGGEPRRQGGAALLARARAEGVLHRLRWFRDVAHDRLPAFLDAVRDSGGVVVSTSRGESFGMTIAEAMARRCAVLAPRDGPFPEFVENGATGRLYPRDDLGAAAGVVEELLTDPAQRAALGVRARESILARHGPDTAVAALVDHLRTVAADPAGLRSRRSA
jgi:glycosyltransferase involved in cell wall biosynthesis